MRRSSHVLIGLCIAAMAVAVSFYCAPPPNEPTVNPPPTAAPDNATQGNTLAPLPDSTELKIPEKDFVASTDKPSDEINPNDPAFQHIRNQLKIDISIPKHTEDLEVLRASGLGKKEPIPDTRTIRGHVEGLGAPSYPTSDLNIPIRYSSFGNQHQRNPETAEPDKAPIKLPDMPEPIGAIKVPEIPAPVVPAKVAPIITNQKMHKLNLAVDQVGKSGITSTEIYFEYAQGHQPARRERPNLEHWDSFAQVPKEIDFCLDKDGVYIVRPVFKSGSGKASDLIKGESLTFILDTVKPRIGFQEIKVNDQKAAIQINARVTDPLLDSKSIVAEYTEDGKTWKPLCKFTEVDGLATQTYEGGVYDLRKEIPLPKDLKTHIFVRMIARDLAGNETIEYYPRRLAVDPVVPKGRLMLSSPAPAKSWWEKVVPLDPIIQANWWDWGNK